jgi:hypothetical protein
VAGGFLLGGPLEDNDDDDDVEAEDSSGYSSDSGGADGGSDNDSSDDDNDASTAPPIKRCKVFVVEPLELFRLKCADHCYTDNMTSTHFKQNNPMVCRVTSR